VNYGQLMTAQQNVTNNALSAQGATMSALGYTPEMMATMVPQPASQDQENLAGLPGSIDALATMLIDLMPD